MEAERPRSNRRFRRLSRLRRCWYLILALFVAVRTVLFMASSFQRVPIPEPSDGEYKVLAVKEAYHFELAGVNGTVERLTIRLLGVRSFDSSRTQWDRCALDVSKELAGPGRTVHLRSDRRRLDRDGMRLGHLYASGKLISAELVLAGLARLDLQPGDSAEIGRSLRKAEDAAKLARAGIWSDTPHNSVGPVAKTAPDRN